MSDGLSVAATVRLPAFALDAAFEAPPGVSVLFGPSGAGKSLTLQAIAGLVPLAAGHITLGGRVLASTSPGAHEPPRERGEGGMARGLALPPRLRRVGYVPQQYALFPHLTVAANVAYALPSPHPPWDRARRAARGARVAELLELVRLPGFEARWPRQLSGGQAQRVALARALAAEPEALLLDEPLSALDAPTRAGLRDDLRALLGASGIPALVVTHDLAEARALADHLVLLLGGRVAAAGPLSGVLAAPPTAEAALLLGWRNVLPVASLAAEAGGVRVALACGQALRLPAGAAAASAGGAVEAALALHADRLEVAAGRGPDGAPAGRTLAGILRDADDAGAYYALRVTVGAGGPDAADVVATCSPREWAALGVAPGAPVSLRVPEGAARLVAALTPRPPLPLGEGGRRRNGEERCDESA